MRLLPDNTTRAAALNTIRELVNNGYAGHDCYDPDRFVVDTASKEMRDNAEVALDQLGATFLRDNGQSVVCLLPRWAWAELGGSLPEIVVPLASRGVGARMAEAAGLVNNYGLHRMIDEVQR